MRTLLISSLLFLSLAAKAELSPPDFLADSRQEWTEIKTQDFKPHNRILVECHVLLMKSGKLTQINLDEQFLKPGLTNITMAKSLNIDSDSGPIQLAYKANFAVIQDHFHKPEPKVSLSMSWINAAGQVVTLQALDKTNTAVVVTPNASPEVLDVDRLSENYIHVYTPRFTLVCNSDIT